MAPTRYTDDESPVVEFDPTLEISPFALFRRLKDDRAPLLVDARSQPSGLTFAGSRVLPADDWQPEPAQEVVFFDRDGSEALTVVQRLQEAGCHAVRMLFGGLELYEFALDPEVVGTETFLVAVESPPATC